ncbi:MAG: hypothetical protein ACR2NV_12025 [Thermoleophilaceae bacterium]
MAHDGTQHHKLVEYLERTAGKEREIESALAAHMVMTSRPAYHERLERHLIGTKQRSERLEKRMEKLGGKASGVSALGSEAMSEVKDAARTVADRAIALARGPIDVLRRDDEASRLLDNARNESAAAAEQMANYTVVRALAQAAGDKQTAKMAKAHHDEHADMSEFVAKLIPKLSKAVVRVESASAKADGNGGEDTGASASNGGSDSSSARAGTSGGRGRSGSSASSGGSSAKRSAAAKRSSAAGGSSSKVGSSARSSSGGSSSGSGSRAKAGASS